MPLLDHGLAGQVRRVRLTRQDQLNGMLPIRQDAGQAIGIAQQKIGPLVGGKAPRKSHGQRVEVEDPLGRRHLFGRRSPAGPLSRQTPARVLDQLLRCAGAQLPEIGIGNRAQVLRQFGWVSGRAIRSAGALPKASVSGDSQVPT